MLYGQIIPKPSKELEENILARGLKPGEVVVIGEKCPEIPGNYEVKSYYRKEAKTSVPPSLIHSISSLNPSLHPSFYEPENLN